MDDQDRSLPEEIVDHLYQVARLAGIYYKALIKQGIPAELAGQIVRDWRTNSDSASSELRRAIRSIAI